MKNKSLSHSGLSKRLADQVVIQKMLARVYQHRESLNEMTFYPEHDKRSETPQFKAVRNFLTLEKDLPCFICGVRCSTLKDGRKNPYGAKRMEAHHHIIEMVLADEISVEKFNQILRPYLQNKYPHREGPIPIHCATMN